MKAKNEIIVTFLASAISAAGAGLLQSSSAWASGQAQNTSQAAVARRIGAIKGINGNVITLAPDSGPEVVVSVQPNARLLRIAPGEKDLKNATPVQLQDLQVGDTIRARGQASADGKSLAALEIIVITRSAVQAISEQIRQDWQKRGIGGPVSGVDPASGTVTVSIPSLGGKKTIVVHASQNTIIRRYAPDSARPEDAKLTTLQEVHVGDQLRARGNRSADGSELAAEEVFTGDFPQFAGLIKSVDASAGIISVQDLANKKTVQLRVTADSQLHKIPDEMAKGMAMRLKAANSSSPSTLPAGANGQSPPGGASSGGMGSGSGRMGGGPRSGAGSDFQRLLDQTPPVALADLHKGDAVAVLTTQGTPAGGSTVVKLYSGVEPILEAPNGSQAMMLAPWSLGATPGGDAGQQ